MRSVCGRSIAPSPASDFDSRKHLRITWVRITASPPCPHTCRTVQPCTHAWLILGTDMIHWTDVTQPTRSRAADSRPTHLRTPAHPRTRTHTLTDRRQQTQIDRCDHTELDSSVGSLSPLPSWVHGGAGGLRGPLHQMTRPSGQIPCRGVQHDSAAAGGASRMTDNRSEGHEGRRGSRSREER